MWRDHKELLQVSNKKMNTSWKDESIYVNDISRIKQMLEDNVERLSIF